MDTWPVKIGDNRIQDLMQAGAQARACERPRVLHLVTSFEAGGTERQFVELLKRLDRERYDVRLAAIRNEGPFYEEIASEFPNIPEFRLNSFYNRNALKQLIRLRRLIVHERIDIIHTHGFYDSLFGALAGRLSRIQVIASQRHLKLSDRQVHEWGTRAIHHLAHRIIVNSEAVRDSIIARGSAPAEKLVLIRNGLYKPANQTTPGVELSTNQCAPADSNEKPMRQYDNVICCELGLSPQVKIIGMVARLVTVKGHRYFMEAAARVLREDARVHFVLVGDGPLRGEIEHQVAQLGIQDRVHLLGDRKDARHLVSFFDVAVLTSLGEGLPNTVMEAMSAGVPVVASASGGTLELIHDNETGFLVPPANAEALSRRLLSVLRDEEKSRQIAERGREFVEAKFGMRRMVESVERLYDKLMADKV